MTMVVMLVVMMTQPPSPPPSSLLASSSLSHYRFLRTLNIRASQASDSLLVRAPSFPTDYQFKCTSFTVQVLLGSGVLPLLQDVNVSSCPAVTDTGCVALMQVKWLCHVTRHTSHFSHITRHTSHVPHHTSRITHHTSRITHSSRHHKSHHACDLSVPGMQTAAIIRLQWQRRDLQRHIARRLCLLPAASHCQSVRLRECILFLIYH
jgi:hypothetical protein